jgi:tellurite resistance protein
MGDPDAILELSATEPARLTAAVIAVIHADGDRAALLQNGAAQSIADQPSDVQTARRFLTLLELGYLVASADGFADEERTTLARLLERVTGERVDHRALELHFRDLDHAVESFGRRERLARAAADLEGTAQCEEAIGLASLIAMADGRIATAEHQTLVDLGEHLGVSKQRVRAIIDAMAKRVEAELQ